MRITGTTTLSEEADDHTQDSFHETWAPLLLTIFSLAVMDDSDREDEPRRILEGEDVVVVGPKRRRRSEEAIKPPTDGELTITVYIVSISAVTNNFSIMLRSTSIKVSNAARYLTEIDPADASNNIDLPHISAEHLHGLVIRHFGEQASNVLERERHLV